MVAGSQERQCEVCNPHLQCLNGALKKQSRNSAVFFESLIACAYYSLGKLYFLYNFVNETMMKFYRCLVIYEIEQYSDAPFV